jgi:hypothetical protein
MAPDGSRGDSETLTQLDKNTIISVRELKSGEYETASMSPIELSSPSKPTSVRSELTQFNAAIEILHKGADIARTALEKRLQRSKLERTT